MQNNLFYSLAALERVQKPQLIQLLSHADLGVKKRVKAGQASKDLGSNPSSGKGCQLPEPQPPSHRGVGCGCKEPAPLRRAKVCRDPV